MPLRPLLLSFASASMLSLAAPGSPAPAVFSPEVLPGRGLAEHDFLFTGGGEKRRPAETISIVRAGEIAWTYSTPSEEPHGRKRQINDATLLSNGNVVFAMATGAMEVTPAKRIVWHYDAPT